MRMRTGKGRQENMLMMRQQPSNATTQSHHANGKSRSTALHCCLYRHHHQLPSHLIMLFCWIVAVVLSLADQQALAASTGMSKLEGQQNPLIIQTDPNFLRFGRSAGGMTDGFADEMSEQWKRTPNNPASANFLRFGKSAPIEPNFLRFGRNTGTVLPAYWLNSLKSNEVNPSFLRFGRRVGGSTSSNFLRFGRNVEEPMLGIAIVDGAGAGFERDYRQPNPNFLRFG